MTSTTLAASAVLLGLAALAFARVGYVVRRRPTHDVDRGALRAFTRWWLGGAAVLGFLALRTALGAAGVTSPTVYVGLQYAVALPLAVAVASLLDYLVYLLTGRRLRVPIYAVYAGFFAMAWAHYLTTSWAVEVNLWNVGNVPIGAPGPVRGIFQVAYGPLLAGPPLLASVAYSVIALRLREPGPRRRAALLAAGLLQVFAVLLAGFLLGLFQQPWFPPVYEASAALTGVLGVLAYESPWGRDAGQEESRGPQAS